MSLLMIKDEEHIESNILNMYLTFDDGPDPIYTPQILDILLEYDARATFFCIGERVVKYPEIVRRIYHEGHRLANHTYSHPFLILLNEERIIEEVIKTETVLNQITGLENNLFRPPYGYLNERVTACLQGLGYKIIMWSEELEMFDWSFPGVEHMVSLLCEKAEEGSIALFHDGGGPRDETVQTIKKSIPLLKSKGFQFSTDFNY